MPKGSALESAISAVDAMYARIERDQVAFLSATAAKGQPLRCPPGCGSCCEPFVPDLLPAEANYAAAWMLEKAPDLVEETLSWRRTGPPSSPPCPFLRYSDSGSRCAIYPARFLICRLFGFSGIRDKVGRAAFRPCAHMPLAGSLYPTRDRSSLSGVVLEKVCGAEPPIMGDYAAQLIVLAPSESGDRHSVIEALPSALIRVGLALSLAAREPTGTYYGQHEGEERIVREPADG